MEDEWLEAAFDDAISMQEEAEWQDDLWDSGYYDDVDDEIEDIK